MVLGEFGPSSADDTYYLLGLDIIGQQQDSTWSYYGYDGLGSVRQVYDSLGAVGYATSYAPYGTAFESYGSLTTSLGFTGEYTDASGLLYLRARYLNTDLGMFLTKDPIEGVFGGNSIHWNRYAYATANPINYIDPSGQFPWVPLLVAIVGIIVSTIVGAIIGAAEYLIPKVIDNIKNGNCIFEDVELDELGKHALKGAAGGFVFGIAFYSGGTVFGAAIKLLLRRIPMSGMTLLTLGRTSNALVIGGSGALAGQASRAATDVLYPDADVDLFQPADMLLDALLAVGLFKAFGGSFDKSIVRVQLSKAGQVPDLNLHTRAGRALQKHGQIPSATRTRTSDWNALAKSLTGEDIPTTALGRNRVGQAILDYIIDNPQTQWNPNSYAKGLGGQAIEARLSNGLGAWWDAGSGEFIGFLD